MNRGPCAFTRLRAGVAPVLLVSLVAGLLLLQLRSDDHHAAPTPVAVRPSSAATVMLGVTTTPLARNSFKAWTRNGLRSVDAFEQAAHKHASIVMWFSDWEHVVRPDIDQLRMIDARGSLPEITWEPWDSLKGLNVPQPRYTLRTIIDGRHDDYIRRWARALASYGGPVRLRFAHEMNGNWYPWAEASNGNRPGDFVKAWRHVHAIFTAAGAWNVEWVWAPVALHVTGQLYPGAAYVDRVGLSGFVGGVQLRFARFRSFDALLGRPLRALGQIAPRKPVEISELGVSDQGGDKAGWITGMFRSLAGRPQIDALVWFNLRKQSDWRIQSSKGVERAFAEGAQDQRFGQRSRFFRLIRSFARRRWGSRDAEHRGQPSL